MEKTTVYGLPLNPKSLLEQLDGASFCVSYATRDKLGNQLSDAIRLVGEDGILMIDNGAFSAWMAGVNTMTDESYLEGFAKWANDILDRCPQAIAVVPDVIDGNEEQNEQLANECMFLLPPERSMPVWHMHESLDYLLRLCEAYDYIAIGSSGAYRKPGTDEWHARVKEAFAAIQKWEDDGEGAYIRPRIHMMRAQAFAHLYPFDSSDSTNVAVNHNRWRRSNPGENHVARLAARVDSKIQLSAGPEAEHQAKRPLLFHQEIAATRWEWALRDARAA